jgi:hypothetical protein
MMFLRRTDFMAGRGTGHLQIAEACAPSRDKRIEFYRSMRAVRLVTGSVPNLSFQIPEFMKQLGLPSFQQ